MNLIIMPLKKIAKLLFNRIFYVALASLIQLGWIFVMVMRLTGYSRYISVGSSILSILVVLWISNKKINPSYKLAWTLLIMGVPVFGLVLYLLFGQSRLARNMQRRYEDVLKSSASYLQEDPGTRNRLRDRDESAFIQSEYIRRVSGYPIHEHTTAEYFQVGDDMFPVLVRELKEAKHYIYIEYFIINDGIMWRTILSILEKKAAEGALNMLHAAPCPTGRMPVVIANGFGGLFFHEACGHSLEASAVADGASEFSGLLGQRVATDKVTLIDDGSMEGEWGSLHMDDEGNLTRRNVLIEKGILKGYMVDRFNGMKLGMEPTGSARRQNYRFMPTSRMTNTYIAPGEDSLEDMIASVERGIYVKSITAGSVNPETGAFNFNTAETYLIENGRIVKPVHGATLIGTGGDILKRVEMVGSDFELRQGFCYAASGAIYIGAGQPSVKISEMTVGGDEA